MNRIYVLGSINMDLVFELDRLPLKGETIHSNKFFMALGGKGANQAIACAKQGIETLMIGAIGEDALSLECIKKLQSSGVDTRYVTSTNLANVGVAGIFIEHGDNRIVVDSGANRFQNEKEIYQIIENADSSDILISQLEIPIDIIHSCFSIAKGKNMKTILNAAPAYVLPEIIYPQIDLLVANETETKILTGILPIDNESAESAANTLIDFGVREVIITLGENGSLYFASNKKIVQTACKVDVVDTTAAGDTYLGVYASSIIQGNDVKKSMYLATLGSSIAITRYGASTSIPTHKEIKEKYKEKINE